MDNLPSLAALRVFESVARQLSFTAAARDLGMTQAGVSYQIRLLEERLGGALFLRKPRGIELTALGGRLAGPTREAFDLLRAAYAPQAEADSLSISTLPTMAGNWLSQRLGRFQADNPNLSVRMEASDHLVDFAREDIDVAIRLGEGDWPGLTAQKLFTVVSAAILNRLRPRVNTTANMLLGVKCTSRGLQDKRMDVARRYLRKTRRTATRACQDPGVEARSVVTTGELHNVGMSARLRSFYTDPDAPCGAM